MKIAVEGYPFIIGSLIPGAALAGLYPVHGWLSLLIIGLVLLSLGLFCTAFFRNPERAVPTGDDVLVSPADGKIVQVLEINDDFVGEAYRVDIFLSVFDVHLNRIPTTGKIEFVNYRPGKFISAFKDKASTDNERTDIGISVSRGRLRVAQIAGLIARRIVCRVKKNDTVTKGQLYGLIRFGSRTEISFPRCYRPCVEPGQRVKGGETIVGRLAESA
ncbi:MAG: phosphatidylserine decarboxylase family protein [FCB group bacterium]|nr:phosphatidylserine decarboxylase family protein [FCB group bacterium]